MLGEALLWWTPDGGQALGSSRAQSPRLMSTAGFSFSYSRIKGKLFNKKEIISSKFLISRYPWFILHYNAANIQREKIITKQTAGPAASEGYWPFEDTASLIVDWYVSL